MPYIEAVRVSQEQFIARVSVERAETICIGDVLPHFEGKQYRTMGTMMLIDGDEGEWTKNHRGTDVRLVEVVVLPVIPGNGNVSHQAPEKAAQKARERRAKKRKPKEQLALSKKEDA